MGNKPILLAPSVLLIEARAELESQLHFVWLEELDPKIMIRHPKLWPACVIVRSWKQLPYDSSRVAQLFFLRVHGTPLKVDGDGRLVPNYPRVVPRRNRFHIARTKLSFRSVVHANPPSAPK